MQLSQKRIQEFQKKILDWYAENKRDLPWREVPYGTSLQQRAYLVLISEVMSQQTQIARVVPKYEAWMKKFPTVKHLANASVAEVLASWSGLGYNRRALNLKKAAEILVKEYTGKFPDAEKELLKLPGIGQYTARALLCFAFQKEVTVIDTNIKKVIVTQFGQDENDQKAIEAVAMQLLPKQRAYDWNQALMDYASAVLKKEKITIPKQSKFVGSHRYYRGQILKKILQKKKISISKLGNLIKNDYSIVDDLWLQTLLQELVTEGFIVVEQGIVRLVS